MDKIEICVECLRTTQKTMLVTDGFKEAWVLKSQIDEDSEVKEQGDEGMLVIPEWLAKDKGFI